MCTFIGRCAVRFVPRENGLHLVHVLDNSVPVPDSPFRCIVGSRDYDVSLVTARGRGLSAGRTGKLVLPSPRIVHSTYLI